VVRLAPCQWFFLSFSVLACTSAVPVSSPLSGEPRRQEPRVVSSRVDEAGGRAETGEVPQEVEVDMDDPGDDSVRASPDCARIGAEGAQSCLAVTLAIRVCETWGPLLRPRVAEGFVGCLSKDSPTSVRATCDTSGIMRCGFEAIAGVRPTGVDAALCTEVARDCEEVAPDLTRPVCERAVAAFRPGARSQITECLQHGCQTGAFGSCIP
jgi:hypothetical protein